MSVTSLDLFLATNSCASFDLIKSACSRAKGFVLGCGLGPGVCCFASQRHTIGPRALNGVAHESLPMGSLLACHLNLSRSLVSRGETNELLRGDDQETKKWKMEKD